MKTLWTLNTSDAELAGDAVRPAAPTPGQLEGYQQRPPHPAATARQPGSAQTLKNLLHLEKIRGSLFKSQPGRVSEEILQAGK